MRGEARGGADVLHHLHRRAADVAAIRGIGVRHSGPLFEHGDAVAHQLDMAELLGGDAGDQAVEGAQLRLAAGVEALEQVVPERGHLAVLAAEQLLQRGGGVGIAALRGRQLGLQLVDAQEHEQGHLRGGSRPQRSWPASGCLRMPRCRDTRGPPRRRRRRSRSPIIAFADPPSSASRLSARQPSILVTDPASRRGNASEHLPCSARRSAASVSCGTDREASGGAAPLRRRQRPPRRGRVAKG